MLYSRPAFRSRLMLALRTGETSPDDVAVIAVALAFGGAIGAVLGYIATTAFTIINAALLAV